MRKYLLYRNLAGKRVLLRVIFEFISLLMAQALWRSCAVRMVSLLLALQLPSGYSEEKHDPVGTSAGGKTRSDATRVKASNLGRRSGRLAGPADAIDSSIPENSGHGTNVKIYGAVGDGLTDDTAAFTAALKAVAEAPGGVCLVPKGTYVISAAGITAPHKAAVLSNVRFLGEGPGMSILKVSGMPTNYLLQCAGDNWSVENLTFDMGDYTPSIGFAAIACKGDHWRVANCAIVRSGRWGITASGGNNWYIERNHISRTVPGATPTTGAILVTKDAGIWSNHGHVIDNVCEGAGMTLAGDNLTISHNRVNRSGFGSGIFVQGAPSTHAAVISNNICSEGSSGYDAAQGGRWWSVNGFEVWAPNSVCYNNTANDNDGGGFAIGGQYSVVVGNKSFNNGRGRPGSAGFVARVNPSKGASAAHSIFIGNRAYDTRYPGHNATQDYGYVEASGVIDVKHFANDYNRNRVRPTKCRSSDGQMPISPEMKNKLRALAEDPDLPDNARRVVQECLAR